MFDKDAEEYVNEHSEYNEIFDMVLINSNTKKTFKDAAEFGYNKANEWHYIKDGELPKDESKVWLYFGDDDYNDGLFIHGRFWCGTCGWFDVAEVIAWKELVPPKIVTKYKEYTND